ncbi:murein transglycosylase C [Thiomicrospira aerophila AL3]|uniref:Murein transglycosylase C n=1 Tax=Thiomicrospira aerophila AL3 TaxID=717772 RepID=W0DX97_9GAMM|nr:murein transglycosylase domain-containing protein [Thiomicrospira aerophila]AHF01599.1 murein transglycosylase C [Thiomicrospira aerophila AL3]
MLARTTFLSHLNQPSTRFWLKISSVVLGLFWVSGYALAQLQQRHDSDVSLLVEQPLSQAQVASNTIQPTLAIITSVQRPHAPKPAPSAEIIQEPVVPETAVITTSTELVAAPAPVTLETSLAVSPSETLQQTVNFVTRPPVFVAINNDVITFEFSAQTAQQQTAMMRALARAMLTDQLFQEEQWLSTQPLNLQARPTLYRRVLDHRQEAVTTPIQAHAYAQFLIQRRMEWVERQGQRVAQIRIPLIQSNLPLVAQPYEPYVLRYANEFKVSPALVFAVMEVESNFNPRAVSRSNALGLMQIKDYAAGLDVYKKIDGINQMPTRSVLFNPEQNIRIGTAYLGLLYHEYFAAVNDPSTRSALVIAAYNGGLNRVWPLFGNDMESAMRQVNRLSTAQVKQRIGQHHPSAETRNYLAKVLNTQAHYQAWLGRDAQPLLAAR